LDNFTNISKSGVEYPISQLDNVVGFEPIGTTYAKLSWLQAWHIRDDAYAAALAELTNAQLNHPFAFHWGNSTTSSSDGQYFIAGGHARDRGNVNPKHGSVPGIQLYTHVSDQYAPFHTKVINVGMIGGKINITHIRANWEEILRLATSIKQGIVTASLIVHKIGSYPRQNGIAIALRELGKIERTIFMLNWFMDPILRRRVTAGLNIGSAIFKPENPDQFHD
jgi:TnpA family transposase